VEQTIRKEPLTLTDILRKRFKYLLDPIAGFLNRLGLMPNTVTIIGLIGNFIGAFFLAIGNLTLGGIIILLMGPIDALDGTMARLRGDPTDFGAFVDSVTDRYSELVILGGLSIHFLLTGNIAGCILAYFAAAGSVLVSYIRARAQSVGYETKIGILSRVERFLVLVPCLIFRQPIYAMWVLAVFTNFTALQRIWHVRKQFYAKHPAKR
jgi:CDP-diacylglycerol---glycerol-3-phosphate 3-phosphatidyltransferase